MPAQRRQRRLEIEVMRFFFDVRKPTTIYDYDGCEFDSVADAVTYAKALARALRKKRTARHTGMHVAVMHENGVLAHEEMVFASELEYARRAGAFV
jgi:hypothetical protein